MVCIKVEQLMTRKYPEEHQPRDQKYFESKFEAHVEDSKEYRQYVRHMPYYMWDGKQPLDVETRVVPMKAIHLSSNSLERLIAEQRHMDSLQDDAEYGKRLWADERRDLMVRERNPAVAKAYQKYLTLLELART
jgi:hypothetical protein